MQLSGTKDIQMKKEMILSSDFFSREGILTSCLSLSAWVSTCVAMTTCHMVSHITNLI